MSKGHDHDPLDDLKHLMDAATPAPDAARRAENLAQAQEIFDLAQGSAIGARPTSDGPFRALTRGAEKMFATLTSRAGMTVTTAIVAVGILVAIPNTRDVWRDLNGVTGSTETLEFPEQALTDEAPVYVEQLVIEYDDTEEQASTDEPQIIIEPITLEPAELPGRLRDRAFDTTTLGRLANTESRAESDNLAQIPTRPKTIAREQAELGLAAPIENPMDVPLMVEPAFPDDGIAAQEPDTESFAHEPESSLKITSNEPVSTFSIDVDTASYSVMRSSIMLGHLPPVDAVRIEELINYFDYDYDAPIQGEAPFKPTVTISETPWNAGTRLMTVALQGEMPSLEDRPPLNLVFLLDTSGSMDQPNKLPLLKRSLRLLLGELRPEDEVAIVTYAGSSGLVLEPTSALERTSINNALNQLDAGGSTAGQAGLQQAYATAELMANKDEVTRVILATDGDFNVGLSDPEELKDYIAQKRDSGTYLSVLGFGRGNLDDATMQALAQNGNGTASYIDTFFEARKVLVDQLSGALFPIANDVKIQVEFNPATISEYRLIGYETRALEREDFNNDRVDAGEIGAGHSVTAIYEITPVGSPYALNDPLRFSDETGTNDNSDELAFLRLRYKEPGQDNSQLIEVPINPEMAPVTEDTLFAVAIAGFGQILKNGKYIRDWTINDAINLAQANLGADEFGYRREAIQLMRLADSLSR